MGGVDEGRDIREPLRRDEGAKRGDLPGEEMIERAGEKRPAVARQQRIMADVFHQQQDLRRQTGQPRDFRVEAGGCLGPVRALRGVAVDKPPVAMDHDAARPRLGGKPQGILHLIGVEVLLRHPCDLLQGHMHG